MTSRAKERPKMPYAVSSKCLIGCPLKYDIIWMPCYDVILLSLNVNVLYCILWCMYRVTNCDINCIHYLQTHNNKRDLHMRIIIHAIIFIFTIILIDAIKTFKSHITLLISMFSSIIYITSFCEMSFLHFKFLK